MEKLPPSGATGDGNGVTHLTQLLSKVWYVAVFCKIVRVGLFLLLIVIAGYEHAHGLFRLQKPPACTGAGVLSV